MPTKLTVEALCVGSSQGVLKVHADSIQVELDGIVGDRHRGFVKPADGRDSGIARGTPVRNWRMWSAVSAEELAVIAERLGIERLDPAILGANITFSGLAELTQIPHGALVWFEGGAIFSVVGENSPCLGPGQEISKQFEHVKPGDFPKVAIHRRGLVGVVHKAGEIRVGETARLQLL